jgi:hypothetical protein
VLDSGCGIIREIGGEQYVLHYIDNVTLFVLMSLLRAQASCQFPPWVLSSNSSVHWQIRSIRTPAIGAEVVGHKPS